MKRILFFISALLYFTVSFSQGSNNDLKGKRLFIQDKWINKISNDTILCDDPGTDSTTLATDYAVGKYVQDQNGIVLTGSVEALTQYGGNAINVSVLDTVRGGRFFYYDGNNLTVDSGVVFPATGKGAGYWIRDISTNTAVALKWFGAYMDGSHYDTRFLQRAINYYKNIDLGSRGTVLIDSVILSKDSVTIKSTGAVIKCGTPSVAKTNAFKVTGDYCNLDLVIDGSNGNRTMVYVDTGASYTTVVLHAANLGADAGSPNTFPLNSGIYIDGKNTTASIYAHHFRNTGRGNNSIPRLITVGYNAGDYYLKDVIGDTVQGGVVCLSQGDGLIDNVSLKNALDNGIYAINGTLKVNNFYYAGTSEEGFVTENTSTVVNNMTFTGKIGTYVGLDDGSHPGIKRDVIIHNIAVSTTDTGWTPYGSGKIIDIRTQTDTIGSIRIGNIFGRGRLSQMIVADKGVVNYMEIHNLDFDFLYDSVLCTSGDRGHWIGLDSVRGLKIDGMHINVIDEKNTLAGNTKFTIRAPKQVYYPSYISDVFVNFQDSSRNNSANGYVNGIGFAQQNLITHNLIWQDDGAGNVYFREQRYNNGVLNSINAIPSGGYWTQGAELLRVADRQPYKYRCIVSGTPGTWIRGDAIRVRNENLTANPSGSITINAGDENILMRANTTGDFTAYLPDAATVNNNYSTTINYSKSFTITNYTGITSTNSIYLKSASGSGQLIYRSFGEKDTVFKICNGCSVTVEAWNNDSWYITSNNPRFVKTTNKLRTENNADTLQSGNVIIDNTPTGTGTDSLLTRGSTSHVVNALKIGSGLSVNSGALVVTPYESATQNYTSGIIFDGTRPSGDSTITYQYFRSPGGNLVTLFINFVYTVAGSTNTLAQLQLPADCPIPKIPAGFANNGNIMYYGVGGLTQNKGVLVANQSKVALGINSTGTGYNIYVGSTSSSAIGGYATITYPTTSALP